MWRGCLWLVAVVLAGAAWADEGGGEESGVFATVGGQVISAEEFRVHLQAAYRQRYYHGRVPERERLDFRREVARRLVDHYLLLEEARRRGLHADAAWVASQVKAVASRYRSLPRWRARRDELVAALRESLTEESLISRLREAVEAGVSPDEAAVRRYYEAHPERFTTPPRLRVSLILLRVEPWAPEASWRAAEEEARRLRRQLLAGADFAELARLHSADDSARRGGDLGYVHEGMLSREAQAAVDRLKAGEISQPVRLLQGYALFRLDERTAPRRNDFARSRERARKLLVREMKARAWQSLLEDLRERTPITIDEALRDGAE